MDYDYEEGDGCVRHAFRSFVCVALTLLIGLHVYAYLWGPQDSIDGGFGEVKYVVMQLTRGLSDASTYRYHLFKQNLHTKLFSRMLSTYLGQFSFFLPTSTQLDF